MGRRLAAIFPHPDDESLFAGALLASAARGGARVQLLCLTRGEAGGSRFGDRGRALGERRTHELEAACRALGIEAPRVCDFGDGGLAALEPRELEAPIAAWLQDLEPDVVVSFGPDGGYGHPDHVACAARTRAAVTRARPAARLLETHFAPGALARVRRALGRFVPNLLPADRLGSPPRPGDLCLTLTDALRAQKRAAVAAHTSQLPGGDPERALAPGALAALCERECYRVAAGPPLPAEPGSDPFAGLA